MEVRQPYGQYERLNQAGWGSQGTDMIWMVLLLVGLPLIALLVLTGLVYEGSIRIDRPACCRAPPTGRWPPPSGPSS